MVTEQDARAVLSDVDAGLPSSREERARLVVERLAALPHFKWVGVYWLHGNELVLGPYVGARTEHTRIAVGQGVCGTAVAKNANQVIRDVRALDNYLSCSLETRSEIVVLIRDASGTILGQIDVDGHEVGAFDESDEVLLEALAGRIAG